MAREGPKLPLSSNPSPEESVRIRDEVDLYFRKRQRDRFIRGQGRETNPELRWRSNAIRAWFGPDATQPPSRLYTGSLRPGGTSDVPLGYFKTREDTEKVFGKIPATPKTWAAERIEGIKGGRAWGRASTWYPTPPSVQVEAQRLVDRSLARYPFWGSRAVRATPEAWLPVQFPQNLERHPLRKAARGYFYNQRDLGSARSLPLPSAIESRLMEGLGLGPDVPLDLARVRAAEVHRRLDLLRKIKRPKGYDYSQMASEARTIYARAPSMGAPAQRVLRDPRQILGRRLREDLYQLNLSEIHRPQVYFKTKGPATKHELAWLKEARPGLPEGYWHAGSATHTTFAIPDLRAAGDLPVFVRGGLASGRIEVAPKGRGTLLRTDYARLSERSLRVATALLGRGTMHPREGMSFWQPSSFEDLLMVSKVVGKGGAEEAETYQKLLEAHRSGDLRLTIDEVLTRGLEGKRTPAEEFVQTIPGVATVRARAASELRRAHKELSPLYRGEWKKLSDLPTPSLLRTLGTRPTQSYRRAWREYSAARGEPGQYRAGTGEWRNLRPGGMSHPGLDRFGVIPEGMTFDEFRRTPFLPRTHRAALALRRDLAGSPAAEYVKSVGLWTKIHARRRLAEDALWSFDAEHHQVGSSGFLKTERQKLLSTHAKALREEEGYLARTLPGFTAEERASFGRFAAHYGAKAAGELRESGAVDRPITLTDLRRRVKGSIEELSEVRHPEPEGAAALVQRATRRSGALIREEAEAVGWFRDQETVDETGQRRRLRPKLTPDERARLARSQAHAFTAQQQIAQTGELDPIYWASSREDFETTRLPGEKSIGRDLTGKGGEDFSGQIEHDLRRPSSPALGQLEARAMEAHRDLVRQGWEPEAAERIVSKAMRRVETQDRLSRSVMVEGPKRRRPPFLGFEEPRLKTFTAGSNVGGGIKVPTQDVRAPIALHEAFRFSRMHVLSPSQGAMLEKAPEAQMLHGKPGRFVTEGQIDLEGIKGYGDALKARTERLGRASRRVSNRRSQSQAPIPRTILPHAGIEEANMAVQMAAMERAQQAGRRGYESYLPGRPLGLPEPVSSASRIPSEPRPIVLPSSGRVHITPPPRPSIGPARTAGIQMGRETGAGQVSRPNWKAAGVAVGSALLAATAYRGLRGGGGAPLPPQLPIEQPLPTQAPAPLPSQVVRIPHPSYQRPNERPARVTVRDTMGQVSPEAVLEALGARRGGRVRVSVTDDTSVRKMDEAQRMKRKRAVYRNYE